MKALAFILIFFSLIIQLIFSTGCGTYVDDDLYVAGTVTGEVFALPNADKDIKIKAYKLPNVDSVYSWVNINETTHKYSLWFVEEYNLPINKAGQKLTFSYLIIPTIESHLYIPATMEVVFIPASRIATFEGDYADDTVLRNYDFNTAISAP
jgi:hypothetical protein